MKTAVQGNDSDRDHAKLICFHTRWETQEDLAKYSLPPTFCGDWERNLHAGCRLGFSEGGPPRPPPVCFWDICAGKSFSWTAALGCRTCTVAIHVIWKANAKSARWSASSRKFRMEERCTLWCLRMGYIKSSENNYLFVLSAQHVYGRISPHIFKVYFEKKQGT